MSADHRGALERLLGPIGADDLAWVEGHVELRRYPPGFAVCLEGQAPKAMFLLLEGRLRISKLRPDKRQEEIARVQPVSLLGHAAVLGKRSYPTTIAALAPSACLLLPRSLLRPSDDPRSAAPALALLRASIRGMNAQLRAVNARLLSMAGSGELISGLAHELGAWSLPDP